MKHHVGLVMYESSLHAWVLDLPGCVTGGRDLDEAAEKLPLVLAEHVGWLRAHGEESEDSREWEVAEEVAGSTLAGGDALFAAEREALSIEELEMLVRRMDHARSDLLSAIDGVPDTVLDWAPPTTAFVSFDAWAPGVRTIRDVAQHVFRFEIYYRDGLRNGQAAGIFEPVAEPARDRAQTVELLRSLSDAGRSQSYRPVRPGQSMPEEWTVRKVVRRVISHERAHTAEVVQRKSWVLLGTPKVS